MRIFANALDKLSEFCGEPIVNDRDRAGVIQGFEFTFEQFWKACQKIARSQGLEVKSPRSAMAAALQLGIILQEEEQLWLQMLKDRNLTSHTYREIIAKEVAENIVSTYLKLLQSSLKKMMEDPSYKGE